MSQSSVAIGDEQGDWFLVNASPDLPAQINSFSDFRSRCRPGSFRITPISGVLLTNADLDHVLGLLSLREGGLIRVYATEAVRNSLTKGLHVSAVLESFCGVDWIVPSLTRIPHCGVPMGELVPLSFAQSNCPEGRLYTRETKIATAFIAWLTVLLIEKQTGDCSWLLMWALGVTL